MTDPIRAATGEVLAAMRLIVDYTRVTEEAVFEQWLKEDKPDEQAVALVQALRTLDKFAKDSEAPPFIPAIVFSDDAIESAIYVLHRLLDFTVDLEIPENTGYPCERVSIVRIDDDGDVVVCETEEDGTPIDLGGTWAVPVNLIKKVTVL